MKPKQEFIKRPGEQEKKYSWFPGFLINSGGEMKNFRIAFLTGLILLLVINCGDIKSTARQKPAWTKLPTGKLGIGSEGYFTTVGISTASFKDAENTAKEELGALIYNLLSEYVNRVTPNVKTELDPLLKNFVEKQCKEAALGAKDYFEVRDKYKEQYGKKLIFFGGEKKFYIFGGIKSEQLLREITMRLDKIYEPDKFLSVLKEQGEIYRVRISSRQDDEISSILTADGFVIDNTKWYAEIIGNSNTSSGGTLKSLSGPLYTVKSQYVITIRDKKGSAIGRIYGNEAEGVSNSKDVAIEKASSQSTVDVSQINKYTASLKSGIEDYLKNEIIKSSSKVEVATRPYYADALKYFEAKDYQATLIQLEGMHFLNRGFPEAMVLYLRAKGSILPEENKE